MAANGHATLEVPARAPTPGHPNLHVVSSDAPGDAKVAHGFTPPFIGSIDQGTSSSRFILFDALGKVVGVAQQTFEQIYPKAGWAEHNPIAILESVNNCIKECMEQVEEKYGLTAKDVVAVGITNQRETTVVWDKDYGLPLHNAIVWHDSRTADVVKELIAKAGGDREHFAKKCGLPFSTYFSGVKLKWLFDNVKPVRTAADTKRLFFGTIDSWLIFKLTDNVHVTDVSNASRTMLMDLNTLQWDKELCDFFGVPMECLPRIASSSEVYGTMADGPLKGVPISGCLGDQQAALVGQRCWEPGSAKSTYGTGCFMLYNTGTKPVYSDNGLLTTVGFQLSPKAPAFYALEGSISAAGSAINWWKNNLRLIDEAKEVDGLVDATTSNGGVYFVPAFGGLFAPYWREDARGTVLGLTQFTTRGHVLRATLEAICFQTRAILDAMNASSGSPLTILKVDGGLSNSQQMVRILSDFVNITVERPLMRETTALGAALAAGLAVGVWAGPEEVSAKFAEDVEHFVPRMKEAERDRLYKIWNVAVEKSYGWAQYTDAA
ncbi:hypothetical protein DFJ74DRAFT_702132 [Hyaloraphidium curvatum]|nr:hypothetical protein DFJ74DRAFT_702132 [Hyaloraphidium curvatum]